MSKSNIVLKFEGHSFEIKEVDGRYDLNNLRKQLLNPEAQICVSGFKSLKSINEWSRSLLNSHKEVYQLESFKGGSKRGQTLANKMGLIAYAGWLNQSFQLAVFECFLAVAEGNQVSANKAVGSVFFDYEKAEEVKQRWLIYVDFNFKCLMADKKRNLPYCMNKLVISQVTGFYNVKDIKGKSDNFVDKLIEQQSYDAILGLEATLNIMKALYQPHKHRFAEGISYEEKREFYYTVKEQMNVINGK